MTRTSSSKSPSSFPSLPAKRTVQVVCMCVAWNHHLFGVSAFSDPRFLLHNLVSMVRGNSLSCHVLLLIASHHWHVHWHSESHPTERTLGCQDSPLIQSNFEKSLESGEAVTGAHFEGLIEESPVTAGVSSSQPRVFSRLLVWGSHGAPQDVASVLVPTRSWQDALTSGLFLTVECCCCSWVILSTRSVSQVGRLLRVFGFFLLLELSQMLRMLSRNLATISPSSSKSRIPSTHQKCRSGLSNPKGSLSRSASTRIWCVV